MTASSNTSARPTGIANQGWKDSFDGINFADGTLARAPIALAEVQAYVYAAYLPGASSPRTPATRRPRGSGPTRRPG